MFWGIEKNLAKKLTKKNATKRTFIFHFPLEADLKTVFGCQNLGLSSKVIYPKYSKHWPYTVAYIEFYMCYPIQISYLNFRAVLGLPKTAGSAQTNKSMSFENCLELSICISLVVVQVANFFHELLKNFMAPWCHFLQWALPTFDQLCNHCTVMLRCGWEEKMSETKK